MAAKDKIIRIGVVGADVHKRGFGARAHLPAVLGGPTLELLAVCTRHDETAQKSAEMWGAPRWYSNHLDLLADPDIDLVTVAINVPSHYPVAKDAVLAGKPVYCEWPLTLTMEEAEDLARLARERNAIAAVGMQGRYAPAIQYLKELLGEGFIGRPLFFHLTHFLPRFPVRSDHWWSADEHSGALNVALSHCSEPLQFLLGPITSVCAQAGTLLPDDLYADTGEPFQWKAEDTVGVLTQMGNGVQGFIQTSNLATQAAGFQLDVFGDDGQVQIKAPAYISYTPARIYKANLQQTELEEMEIPARFNQAPDLSMDSPGHTLAHALMHLGRVIHGEVEAYRPNFDDGLRQHRLVAAIRQSSHSGTWVDMED